MKRYKEIKSPIGKLLLLGDEETLTGLYFENHEPQIIEGKNAKEDPFLKSVENQLDLYFHKKLETFDIKLKPQGTPFQMAAWKALTHIPYGKTWSYGAQASFMGDVKKARAVGGANGKNPIPIIIPCHRVIGKSGDLTGFGGGIKIKRFLLDLECQF